MEEKAKRVGKFNVVDVIAVILILAVAALVGWKLLGPDDSVSAERAMTKVTYVVKVEGVPAELYDNCIQHLPSPLMASGALVGGEIVGYTEMLNEARQIATERMVDEAVELGADAIINIRYGSSAVMQGAAEVIAYGTAVKYL